MPRRSLSRLPWPGGSLAPCLPAPLPGAAAAVLGAGPRRAAASLFAGGPAVRGPVASGLRAGSAGPGLMAEPLGSVEAFGGGGVTGRGLALPGG